MRFKFGRPDPGSPEQYSEPVLIGQRPKHAICFFHFLSGPMVARLPKDSLVCIEAIALESNGTE